MSRRSANWQTPRNLFPPRVRKNFAVTLPPSWKPKATQPPRSTPKPNERRRLDAATA
jgi:hypothetical protein